jgi:hypothetical protein
MNFEGLKGIFNLLKVKHTPKKHWIDSTVVPIMIKVHYFVHWTNLAMLLSKLSLVVQLEMLLQAMYVFFFHTPKKFLEF